MLSARACFAHARASSRERRSRARVAAETLSDCAAPRGAPAHVPARGLGRRSRAPAEPTASWPLPSTDVCGRELPSSNRQASACTFFFSYGRFCARDQSLLTCPCSRERRDTARYAVGPAGSRHGQTGSTGTGGSFVMRRAGGRRASAGSGATFLAGHPWSPLAPHSHRPRRYSAWLGARPSFARACASSPRSEQAGASSRKLATCLGPGAHFVNASAFESLMTGDRIRGRPQRPRRADQLARPARALAACLAPDHICSIIVVVCRGRRGCGPRHPGLAARTRARVVVVDASGAPSVRTGTPTFTQGWTGSMSGSMEAWEHGGGRLGAASASSVAQDPGQTQTDVWRTAPRRPRPSIRR